MWLCPTEIRFTHDSISPNFSCGRYSIYETYDELKRGFKTVGDIPTMTVTLMNDEWYTYTGNRRLWVFQKLACRGYVGEIYVHTTDRRVPMSKFTTNNGGTEVRIRGDRVCRLPPPPDAARNVACPVCGVVRFKSGMGAVMHVESGSCSGCRGADNARRQIYDFARSHSGTQSLLAPMLMDRLGSTLDPGDKPYQCQWCRKTFRQMSQLMQHTQDKHDRDPPRLALGYR